MTKLEEELASVSPTKDMLLTIGTFDGVHIGHKYLIARLKEEAEKRNLLSGVITFNQNPKMVMHPQSRILSLTSLSRRIDLLKEEGVDHVIPLSFTTEVAQMSAREFVGMLQKYLKMRGLVIGYDFNLGRDKEGDYNALCRLGEEMVFSVVSTGCRRLNEEIVSSTAIRKALAGGDRERAFDMLGWGKETAIAYSCQ